MNLFGMGLPEMGVIAILALLIFGPKKLPEIGRSLGKTIKSFQDASREFQSEFAKEVEKEAAQQAVAPPAPLTSSPEPGVSQPESTDSVAAIATPTADA